MGSWLSPSVWMSLVNPVTVAELYRHFGIDAEGIAAAALAALGRCGISV